jgi:hypothetical protein
MVPAPAYGACTEIFLPRVDVWVLTQTHSLANTMGDCPGSEWTLRASACRLGIQVLKRRKCHIPRFRPMVGFRCSVQKLGDLASTVLRGDAVLHSYKYGR